MDVIDISKLRYSGVDADGALMRFSGNTALYDKFLKKFLTDDTFIKMADFIRVKDFEEAHKCAHSLKGVTGNLGLTDLYNACEALCKVLQAGVPEPIVECYNQAKRAYDTAIEVISSI